jgi:hypothetical protein
MNLRQRCQVKQDGCEVELCVAADEKFFDLGSYQLESSRLDWIKKQLMPAVYWQQQKQRKTPLETTVGLPTVPS